MTGAMAMECPGPLTLYQYANGHLDPAQSERIAAHVRKCSRCSERVQQTGNDGRSLADALEPRDPMALETAEDVLRRLDLDLDFSDLDDPPKSKGRAPTPAPPRSQLPPPAGMRGKGPRPLGPPPPRKPMPSRPRPSPAASLAPVAPPPFGESKTEVALPPLFDEPKTQVAPPPRPPEPAKSAKPPSAPPPVPMVRTSASRESQPAPVVDAGRSRRWLFVSIAVFAVLGVGAASALIVYPRVTGEELRWASVVGAFEGGAQAEPPVKQSALVEDGPAKAVPAADGEDEKAADGEGARGEAADGEAAQGEAADGEEAQGEAADGEEAQGEAADGEAAQPDAVHEGAGDPNDPAPTQPVAPQPSGAEPPPQPAYTAKPPPATAAAEAAAPRYTEPVGSRDPAEAQDLARRGSLALRKSELPDAESLFQRALAHDPRNATALGGLAALHFDQGRHRTALKFAAKAVSAAPQDPDLRILLGDAYLETRAYANARREYQKAVALGHRSAPDRLARLDERIATP